MGIFDCQKHVFTAPSPQKLVGNLQWRIKDPVAQTSFVTRYTVQEFEMDKTRQGILYNHDNDFLHYKDVVAIEREVVKDVSAIEKEIEKDVVGLEKEIVKD